MVWRRPALLKHVPKFEDTYYLYSQTWVDLQHHYSNKTDLKVNNTLHTASYADGNTDGDLKVMV
jgi:hypothetical protein